MMSATVHQDGLYCIFFDINLHPRTLAMKKHIAHGRGMGLTGSLLTTPAFVGL